MNKAIYDKEPAVCNCLNMRRASKAVTEVYDKFLLPSGLKISQFSLLKHIKGLGPVSVSDLAVEIRLDRTTLVRNLKPLEGLGLVTDNAIKGTRNRQLKLTDKGNESLEKAEQLWLEAQNFMEQYLGKNDLNTLTGLLSKIEALAP
jgi:DNA-binding MarR family transcriptional regulator